MGPADTVNVILALLLLFSGCVHTLPFKDANGDLIPDSVATMQFVNIGGTSQSVWFRGTWQSSPALILLHGGPGTSESALFRHYNSMLEHHFLVVYWEQRRTGRSFNSLSQRRR
jgi:proline iminopeptidase